MKIHNSIVNDKGIVARSGNGNGYGNGNGSGYGNGIGSGYGYGGYSKLLTEIVRIRKGVNYK